MKFAKELEDSIVPEWRAKYIDYKGGKKRIKAVVKASKYAQASPAVNSLYINSLFQNNTVPIPVIHGSHFVERDENGLENSPSPRHTPQQSSTRRIDHPPASHSPVTNLSERNPLKGALAQALPSQDEVQPLSSYGTMIGQDGEMRLSNLQLPEPLQMTDYERNHEIRSGKRGILPLTRTNASAMPNTASNLRPGLLRRVRSQNKTTGIYMTAEDIRDDAINIFFEWLESELDKVDSFYQIKEEEAVRKLDELREQLHIMRDIRIAEMRKNMTPDAGRDDNGVEDSNKKMNSKKKHLWNPVAGAVKSFVPDPSHSILAAETLQRITTATSHVSDYLPKIGSKAKSSDEGAEEGPVRHVAPAQRDYSSRRKPINDITYNVAKRKLKTAIIEYYHGLELLKSYCHQNREGLRKINKKFDKATGLRTSKQFMSEKINKSYFGMSDVLENLIYQTEDLFARYFQGGDRKHAVERLRTKEKSSLYYGSWFRSALLLGLSIPLAITGLLLGLQATHDPETGEKAVYILQLWAGFFLPLLFVLAFTVNCRVWAKNKINYVFCFEFDIRHNLDYHQFLEIPSVLFFLFTLSMWLNFSNFWPERIDPIYYPVLYLAVVLVIMINPAPILYRKSRYWFLEAHWRLLWSGFYPVEFRDFWLGDMLCSQTYTMGNIWLSGCLYSGHWDTPGICNSSNSRGLGAFTCLPAIFRLIQCIRRFRDTRNAFPHLANAAKYSFTIIYYMCLSLWRIGKGEELKALFMVIGILNAVYSAIWDLAMDWSLCNPYATWPLLRQELGYKRPLYYYGAMILDPILRFNWIFYIIYARDIQHSNIVSFAISLSEILRRWMWCFFRMENEHCTNVSNNRAYREVQLPYDLPPQQISRSDSEDILALRRADSIAHHDASQNIDFENNISHVTSNIRQRSPSTTTLPTQQSNSQQPITSIIEENPVLERQHSTSSSFMLRGQSYGNIQGTTATPTMRSLTAVGSAVARAHAQDFQRRKPRPGIAPVNSDDEDDDDGDSSTEGAFDEENTTLPPRRTHQRGFSTTSAASQNRRW